MTGPAPSLYVESSCERTSVISLQRGTRRAAADLRVRWSTATGRRGWSQPLDWWVPEVDALAEALAERRDPVPAAAALGRARSEAGVALGETLDDVEALLEIADLPVDPVGLVRAVAEAWVEAGADPIRLGTCDDPLSGLSSAVYLRTRLGEVYREPQFRPDRWALVVARWNRSPGAGFDRVVSELQFGQLRLVFPAETAARLGTSTAVVLARRSPPLQWCVAALRRRLRGSRVWVEGLPENLAAAYALLDDLSR